jgi:transcriptional regulator with PAS, ATPase and Fis domain
MNIMDFVDSIKLQLCDLEKVGKIGYVEGISNIIVKNLNSLDETKRPVHCTDAKREVMYVKDEDKWEKENESKQKIRKAIKHVAHKNSKMLKEFKTKHPDCDKSESKFSDQYNKLVIEALGGKGDNDLEKEDKIIKNIAKEVVIDKHGELI